ncbi:type II toxin-antitoxin system RelB family antitoxin [Pseudomonas azerbaijanoccidentalis]
MNALLSPIVSEFETEEQAASYDRWYRAKVQASLDDPRPSIPHDQVMAEMRALLESKRTQRNAG